MSTKNRLPARVSPSEVTISLHINTDAVVLDREGSSWRAYRLWDAATRTRCRARFSPPAGMRTKAAFVEHLRSLGQVVYKEDRSGDFVLLARPYGDVSSNVR